MKVRWTDESLRLRITPTELERIARGDAVDTAVGPWAVHLAPGGADLALAWDGATATVTLPIAEVAALTTPEREGVYAHRDGFRLLVEKDFPCRHPHAGEAREPETERFAPPPGAAS